jgi:hypothetical protein
VVLVDVLLGDFADHLNDDSRFYGFAVNFGIILVTVN